MLRSWRGKRERNSKDCHPQPRPTPELRRAPFLPRLPLAGRQTVPAASQPRSAPSVPASSAQQPGLPSALSPRLSGAPELLGRRTMLAVGPPLHRHGDCASQQFVAAGVAPPVPDQKGVYLGDAGVSEFTGTSRPPAFPSPTKQAAPPLPSGELTFCPCPTTLLSVGVSQLLPFSPKSLSLSCPTLLSSPSISFETSSREFSQTPFSSPEFATPCTLLLDLQVLHSPCFPPNLPPPAPLSSLPASHGGVGEQKLHL